MKYSVGLWLICILYMGCKPLDHQIKVYFDPSGAFFLEKIPLMLKVDDHTILDTIVENRRINESLFMISFDVSEHCGALFAEVNGKKRFVKQLHKDTIKCTDIFLGYDDKLLIFKKVRKIEAERQDKQLPADFRQLFDSIKASSGNKYDQITLNIKERDC